MDMAAIVYQVQKFDLFKRFTFKHKLLVIIRDRHNWIRSDRVDRIQTRYDSFEKVTDLIQVLRETNKITLLFV